jgi:hypothetical protein
VSSVALTCSNEIKYLASLKGQDIWISLKKMGWSARAYKKEKGIEDKVEISRLIQPYGLKASGVLVLWHSYSHKLPRQLAFA